MNYQSILQRLSNLTINHSNNYTTAITKHKSTTITQSVLSTMMHNDNLLHKQQHTKYHTLQYNNNIHKQCTYNTQLYTNIQQQSQSQHQYKRLLHTTIQVNGLSDFFTNQQVYPVGRSWGVSECRLKSSDELHKLWFILIKERNMLYTYRHICDKYKITMKGTDRLWKIKSSLTSIKFVLGERRHKYKMLTDNSYVNSRNERLKEYRAKRVRQIKHKQNEIRMKKQYQFIKEKHHIRKKIAFKNIKPNNINDNNNNTQQTTDDNIKH